MLGLLHELEEQLGLRPSVALVDLGQLGQGLRRPSVVRIEAAEAHCGGGGRPDAISEDLRLEDARGPRILRVLDEEVEALAVGEGSSGHRLVGRPVVDRGA